MFHDGNGMPLKIGDLVLFRPRDGTTERTLGIIISFTSSKVHIRRESDKKTPPKTLKVLRNPTQLILLNHICHKYNSNKR